MTKKARLGIVGLGAQGSVYAGLVSDGMVRNMELGAICARNPATRELVESKYPAATFYDDYRTMLDSGTVDGVVTCVPSYLHPQMGIQALQHDVHVLLEKPAGIYTKQVVELNAIAATKPELTFAIMFNERNNPLYRKIKEIVSSGAIGEIRHTNWIITTWWRPQSYYDQTAWRGTWGGEGGGVLVNQAPHQLDLWLWVCGLPQSVYAKVAYGFRRAIAVEDEATAIVDYGRGATGVFITATHDLVGTDRFEILGDNGKIVIEDSDRHSDAADEARARTRRRDGPREHHETAQRPPEPKRLLLLRSHRGRVAVGTPTRGNAGELRGKHPERHSVDRTGGRGHQQRPVSERHPPVELERSGGAVRLRR
jgi:UDP-N-acetyl-2-amino-2-deoxyglucuronate dehydrogenase